MATEQKEPKKRLLSLEEASLELGQTVRCLRDWIAQGKIDYVKIGKAYRIEQRTIDEMIERWRVAATTTTEVRKPVGAFRKKEKVA